MPKFPFIKVKSLSIFSRLSGIDWSVIGILLDGWKDGQEGWLDIHKKGKPKSPEQLGYYYALILPTAFEDFKKDGDITLVLNLSDKSVEVPLTMESVDWFFKLNYGAYHGEYKDKADMSMAECAAFEQYVVDWLAKWRKVQVPPSDPAWNARERAVPPPDADLGK